LISLPAAQAAQAADVVVLCLGEGSYAETPGNITDLTLGEPQLKLAEAIEGDRQGRSCLCWSKVDPRIINRIVDRGRGYPDGLQSRQ